MLENLTNQSHSKCKFGIFCNFYYRLRPGKMKNKMLKWQKLWNSSWLQDTSEQESKGYHHLTRLAIRGRATS